MKDVAVALGLKEDAPKHVILQNIANLQGKLVQARKDIEVIKSRLPTRHTRGSE